MKKLILNLKGAHELSVNEQKAVKGGAVSCAAECSTNASCVSAFGAGFICASVVCTLYPTQRKKMACYHP